MCRRPEMPRRRAAYGVARLVVVLFAVAGLAVTYGTGQSRPVIPCKAHDIPAGATAAARATAAAQETGTHLVMTGVPRGDPYRHGPLDGTAPLAALVILLTLGLAGHRTRARQRPVRSGRTAAPPALSPRHAPSLAFLQVLRL